MIDDVKKIKEDEYEIGVLSARIFVKDLDRAIEESQDHHSSYPVTLYLEDGKTLRVWVNPRR